MTFYSDCLNEPERAKLRAMAPPAPPAPPEPPPSGSDSRPVIRVDRDQYLISRDAIDVLGKQPTVYQRDGQLVRSIRVGEHDAQPHLPAGALAIRSMAVATIKNTLTEAAVFCKMDARKKQIVPAKPPCDVVEAVYDHGEYPHVRTLVGIAEAPFMRPDGTICNEPGYDRATGFIFEPQIEFPAIPDRPTQDYAKASFQRLLEPFADFPFLSDVSRCVPIAALLSLLARPMIIGNVPLFLVDAPALGSGKTIACDIVSIIATGRPAAKMTWPSSSEELEKILSAVARDATPLVLFDNVAASLGGDALNKVITCGGRVKLRILGKSETPEYCWNTVIMANGNNVTVEGDAVRRIIPCRIESPLEHPEERQDFKHPEILQWVTDERPRLVANALTVLRAWVVAGQPSGGISKLGSFERWSAIVPPSILFAGGSDPTLERARVEEGSSDERADMIALLDVLHDRFIGGATAVKMFSLIQSGDEEIRSAFKALIPDELTAVLIGKFLRRHTGRVIGGRRIAVLNKDRTNKTVWIVYRQADQAEATEPRQADHSEALEY